MRSTKPFAEFPLAFRLIPLALAANAIMTHIASEDVVQSIAPANTFMCIPGELVLSDEFAPETVSERWFFKGEFALREGALLRTNVAPTESKRVFLKDASFHNTIIQFDFKLSGETTDLRLVTGSGGGYNSVTQIRPSHFQINTPVDREAGIVPCHLGECVRQPRPDQWQTITVEYWNDEIVVHLDESEFIVGRHPIIDRTRKYFAFQFDLPGASIDNVRVWNATGQRNDWPARRAVLMKTQAEREPVPRDPDDRFKYQYTNLKSRLTLEDAAYRDLVARYDRLKSELHADYPEAFASHKELSKQITKRKKQIKETDPAFKRMEREVHKASRAEDEYVLSTKPEIRELPKHRYASELGQIRAKLEAAGDQQLAAMVAETAKRQAALEAHFPDAFMSVDAAVIERNAARKALNDDSKFKARNKTVNDAGKAIKEYEHEADPSLSALQTASNAYSKK